MCLQCVKIIVLNRQHKNPSGNASCYSLMASSSSSAPSSLPALSGVNKAKFLEIIYPEGDREADKGGDGDDSTYEPKEGDEFDDSESMSSSSSTLEEEESEDNVESEDEEDKDEVMAALTGVGKGRTDGDDDDSSDGDSGGDDDAPPMEN
jgi:hypothetical protein